MSLEDQIASLVAATTNLTNEVAGKMASINQTVAAATQAVPAAIKSSMASYLYVDAIAGSDANDGKTFGKAFKTIKAAIESVPHGAFVYLNLVGSGDPLAPTVYAINDAIDVDGKHVTLSTHGAGQKIRLNATVWVRHGSTVRIGNTGQIDVEQNTLIGWSVQGGHVQHGGYYGAKYTFLVANSVLARVGYQGSDYKAERSAGSLDLQNIDFSGSAVAAKLGECYIHGMLTLNTRGVNLGANVTLPTEQNTQIGTSSARIYAL